MAERMGDIFDPSGIGSGRPCAGCGALFMPIRSTQKRCSHNCGRKRAPYVANSLTPAIALDGEGIGQRYVLLAASTGAYVGADDLSTEECLKFLVSLPRTHLKFAFAFSYDVNMILRDFSWSHLERLRDRGQVYWGDWRIEHRIGKRFGVRHRPTGNICVVWDMFPFVQQSFVKWLKDWALCDAKTLEFIGAMKDRRDDFSDDDREEMLMYCLAECRLLAAGARRLQELCRAVNVPLSSYYGAGSIASSLMQRFRIKDFQAPPPPEIETILDSAYFGGRSENATIGRIEGPIHAYDLNSAYPSQAANLPCLAHAEWEHRSPMRREHGLNFVRWNLPLGARWGPLPVRPMRGSLRYPCRGEGWYWRNEIAAAQIMYPGYICVEDAWALRQNCDHRPFQFVPILYGERQKLKRAGDLSEKVLKLGLNALYGKLAQHVGRAPYRSLAWAGLITAGTRARILDALRLGNRDVLAIATDGIIASAPIPALKVSDKLGAWSETIREWIFLAQCGVYFFPDSDGIVRRSRGFVAKELDYATVFSAFMEGGLLSHVRVPVRRFVSYSNALRSTDRSRWRSWSEDSRALTFCPFPRRMFDLDCMHGAKRYESWAPGDATSLESDTLIEWAIEGEQIEYMIDLIDHETKSIFDA